MCAQWCIFIVFLMFYTVPTSSVGNAFMVTIVGKITGKVPLLFSPARLAMYSLGVCNCPSTKREMERSSYPARGGAVECRQRPAWQLSIKGRKAQHVFIASQHGTSFPKTPTTNSQTWCSWRWVSCLIFTNKNSTYVVVVVNYVQYNKDHIIQFN